MNSKSAVVVAGVLAATSIFSQASGSKRIGEVPEAKDSYQDPGFGGGTNGAPLHNLDGITNFQGNRMPGLPETLRPDERPNFPQFKYAENGKVILYHLDRNGNAVEDETLTREKFEQRRAEFEASEARKAEKEKAH